MMMRMPEISLQPVTARVFGAVLALHQRSEAFDGVPRVMQLEEIHEIFDDDEVVLVTDTRIATVADTLVGYAYTLHLPSDVALERAYIFGQVDPAHRGIGVGRALMQWAVPRAREQLLSSGNDLPKFIRTDAYDYVTSAHHLFDRLGLEPVRYFEELLRPLSLPLPELQVRGARVEPWPVDRDDELRAVKNASFADHWGSTPVSAEQFEQRMGAFGMRLDLSRVAVDEVSGGIVGFCLAARYPDDDDLIGRRDGWIDNVGTLREWRGRGVASALMVASMQAFVANALTHASLTVDSASPTGASRLYRALGFEIEQRSITHERQVP